MSTQPEALRLADALEWTVEQPIRREAAAELRRLHAENERLTTQRNELRDRLAKQCPRLWVLKDNPGISTMREPSEKALWEPLGNIV